MKLRLTFKSPDALNEAIQDACKHLQDQDAKEAYAEELQQVCKKWIRYSEYLRVEIDTDTSVIVVLPAGVV